MNVIVLITSYLHNLWHFIYTLRFQDSRFKKLIALICSALIKLVQNSTSDKTQAAAIEVAISLFYHLSSMVSEDTRYYPPTRQFFSACIEMLGQVCSFCDSVAPIANYIGVRWWL